MVRAAVPIASPSQEYRTLAAQGAGVSGARSPTLACRHHCQRVTRKNARRVLFFVLQPSVQRGRTRARALRAGESAAGANAVIEGTAASGEMAFAAWSQDLS